MSGPLPIPSSATAGDASASANAPKSTTIGGGDAWKPQAPSPSVFGAGSAPGTSTASGTPEV